MPSDLPHTPQSPSQRSFYHFPLKPIPSPTINNSSLLTPAHSVSGSMSSLAATELLPVGQDTSNKRKRHIEDQGDQEQKKIHLDNKLTIGDLHLEVGEKYLLCRTPHARTTLDCANDLLPLCGVDDIVASVARQAPDGSKKIIRKTYKNYIKNLGLAGNFDIDRKGLDAEDTLSAMLRKPQDVWDAEMGDGQDIWQGLSESVLASLPKATLMIQGPLKKEHWDPSVLGELGGNATPFRAMTPVQPVANVVMARPAKSDGVRAKRNIRKRSYADSSFEGYCETFVDDMEGGEYGGEDGDERGPRKKYKKSSFIGSRRQESYGPGMVGA